LIALFNTLRDCTFLSICVRMLLATLCGGIIGIEREYKRRPAGFRTHILICLGAAMTTLTSQYLFLEMSYNIDLARLGAQVIAGIGFIGAGTIIVSQGRRIKGLTTAAGLWTSAIVGLALGAGFYEGGLFTTALILLAELLFSKLEYYILNNTPEFNLYLEYEEKLYLDSVISLLRKQDVRVLNLEVLRSDGDGKMTMAAILSLRVLKKNKVQQVIESIRSIKEISLVEEL